MIMQYSAADCHVSFAIECGNQFSWGSRGSYGRSVTVLTGLSAQKLLTTINENQLVAATGWWWCD